MSDVNDLSGPALAAAVAEAMGWEWVEDGCGTRAYRTPEGRWIYNQEWHPESDWRDTGEVLEWLKEQKATPTLYLDVNGSWVTVAHRGRWIHDATLVSISDPDPRVAICRAAVEWSKQAAEAAGGTNER